MSGRGRSSGRPTAPRSGRDGGRDRAGGGPRRHPGRDREAARQAVVPRLDPAARCERLREVVEPVIQAAGYDLEDLVLSRAGRRHLVRVVVDGDGGVSLDDVAEVSRAVSAALDAAEQSGGELLPGEYALEVGSPGVDRPLTLPRHWRRNVGRLVAVQVRAVSGGDRQLTGRVLAADDEGIVLDVAGGSDGGPRELAYEQLGPGRVQIEFTRWGEAEDGDETDELDDEDLEEER